MSSPKWVAYKNFSGVKIAGTVPVEVPNTGLHLDHAYYLTACLEAPLYGSVQSYDGAGMSGGPLHNIAVYPKTMQQGTLFSLIKDMRTITQAQAVKDLVDAYDAVGWELAADGFLYSTETSKKVTGKEIRDTLSGPNGIVPRRGPVWDTAVHWAELHAAAFADPTTFGVQKNYAVNYLLKTQKVHESVVYENNGLNPLTLRVVQDGAEKYFSYEEDLAMCVYHAHSVNGPAPALSVLNQVTKRYTRGKDFARAIIRNLGTKKYGHWLDTADGRNRYDRTRFYAKKSGLWPERLFVGKDAIMPADLAR